MDDVPGDGDPRRGLAAIQVGDLRCGTVTAASQSGQLQVALDGVPGLVGMIGPLDQGWPRPARGEVKPGDRIAAGVIAVDADHGRIRLSAAAARNRDLWTFLNDLRPGETVLGTIAAIESFGVFVALDEGPRHPVFPGVGFITVPELSWSHFESAEDVVQVGQRVSCEFLQFDTSNGEARLSLRALQPDPVRAFLNEVAVGKVLSGTVIKVVPPGDFVRVADGVEGLVPAPELAVAAEALQAGDVIMVAVVGIDRGRRRLTLSQRAAHRGPR